MSGGYPAILECTTAFGYFNRVHYLRRTRGDDDDNEEAEEEEEGHGTIRSTMNSQKKIRKKKVRPNPRRLARFPGPLTPPHWPSGTGELDDHGESRSILQVHRYHPDSDLPPTAGGLRRPSCFTNEATVRVVYGSLRVEVLHGLAWQTNCISSTDPNELGGKRN